MTDPISGALQRGGASRTTWLRINGVALALAVGHLLALVREMLIAAEFGATHVTDAYVIASSIPDIVMQISLAGAVEAAAIPILTSNSGGDRGKLWRTAGSLIKFYALLALVILPALWILMPLLIGVIAPGFDDITTDLATNLARPLAPIAFILAIAGIIGAALNITGHFVLPSLKFAIQSAILIATIILIAPKIGIWSAALGTVAGTIAALLAVIPLIPRAGYQAILESRVSRSVIGPYVRLAVPVMLTVYIIHISLVVEKAAASLLPVGAVTAVMLARRIAFVPVSLGSQALITVVYPKLSETAATDRYEFARAMRSAFFMTAVALSVMAAAMWVIAESLVRLLIERGAFSQAAADNVVELLKVFALGIPLFGTNSLMVRFFHAARKAMVPLWLSIITFLPYVVLVFSLPSWVGIIGIPLALLVSDFIRLTMFLILLERFFPGVVIERRNTRVEY